jgi:hypothetical protein
LGKWKKSFDAFFLWLPGKQGRGWEQCLKSNVEILKFEVVAPLPPTIALGIKHRAL